MSVEELENAFKIKKGSCNHIPKNDKFCDHLDHMEQITEGYWLVRFYKEALPYDKDILQEWEDQLQSMGWEVVIKEDCSHEMSSEEIWIVKNL